MSSDRLFHSAVTNDRTRDVEATTSTQDLDGWQLAYTVARHEKVVNAQLQSRGIDSVLPIYKTVHRWNKRNVTVELPLFPNYVFLRCNESNRQRVITVSGIVNLVRFQGQMATIPNEELQAVLNALKFRQAVPCPYVAVGQSVRIIAGPLSGVVGVIERIKGIRVIVSVHAIASSIAIEADAADLSSLN